MATISDIENTPYSTYQHIDALLDEGPDWNYITTGVNTIRYTFSTASGLEDIDPANPSISGSVTAFNAVQQKLTRDAIAYIEALTGIDFVETPDGTAADIHFGYANIVGANTSGLCSWEHSYKYTSTSLVEYKVDAWVYLDNVEWGAMNADLTPGKDGYETLLHELGHALGLKHPFDDSPRLPTSLDSTVNTLMSYNSVGGPYQTFQQFDVAALNWLYGGDGLKGAFGINSTSGGRYVHGTLGADALTGTTANDTLRGDAGNDTVDGGGGTDVAVLNGSRAMYTFAEPASGTIALSSKADGVDTYRNIELFRFADGTLSAAGLMGATTAGNDVFVATSGNNSFDGSAGLDTVQFSAARASHTIVRSGSAVTVTDNSGSGGIDSLQNVERLQFGDVSVAVDIDGNGGKAYRVYQAAFDRLPDAGGVGFWMYALDNGTSLVDIAAGFMASPEFIGMYGANPSTTDFVSKLYQNILHRQGETEGINFWVSVLDQNLATRAAVLADFSGQPENIALVAPTIQNGFVYTPWVG